MSLLRFSVASSTVVGARRDAGGPIRGQYRGAKANRLCGAPGVGIETHFMVKWKHQGNKGSRKGDVNIKKGRGFEEGKKRKRNQNRIQGRGKREREVGSTEEQEVGDRTRSG